MIHDRQRRQRRRPGEDVMRVLQGRINRAAYWLAVVVTLVLLTLITILAPTVGPVSEGVLVIACVPRLHDIGRSGWLVVGPLLIDIAGSIAPSVLPSPPAAAWGVALLIAEVVIVGLVIWLGAVRGDPAPNRFGAPPPPGLHLKRRSTAG